MKAGRVADDRLDRFWTHCREARGLPAQTRWRARRIGDAPEICALLVELIRSGRKTGTFALLAEFEEHGQPVPQPGEYLVITDFEGEPGCAVELIEIEVLPFDRVTTDWIEVEGPQLRELDAWRKVHAEYWTGLAKRWNRTFSQDMSVVCQRFGTPFTG